MKLLDAYDLACKLMNTHNLKTWVFKFDRAKRRAGSCCYSDKTITLSQHYVEHNEESDVKNTILHEISHALCPGDGHGEQWKNMAILIGARPERCYREHIKIPEGKWQAICGGCNYKYAHHRRPKHLNNRFCRKCGPLKGHLFYKCLISN